MFRSFADERAPIVDFDVPDLNGLRGAARQWSVLIPFFNERLLLPETIASLARQTLPFDLILIDNGSTDGSAEVAREACRRFNLAYTLVCERRRGKVAALAAGLQRVTTPYVATCDADTWYPRDYLAQATRLLAAPDCVAAGAYFIDADASESARQRKALHVMLASRLMPGQCHTGGAGQLFETAALRLAGGFDPDRWNLVLEDHEVVHQLLKTGRMRYSQDLWCSPSGRERDRVCVSWTLVERLAYHLLVERRGDWFFRDFLGPRLMRRKLTSERLRETVHLSLEADDGASYALC
jgi:glycosyltransferase involved in cell wall biosynthesis